MTQETQRTILEWATETFGPPSAIRIMARAAVEIAELLHKTSSPTSAPAAVVDECADVAVMVCQVAELRGIDMEAPCENFTMRGATDLVYLAGDVARIYGILYGVLGRSAAQSSYERRYYVDLWTSLERLVELQATGETLREARTRKMAVNRARRWATDREGRSQHVEE